MSDGMNDAIVTACWEALKDNGSRFDAEAFRASLSAAGYAVVPVEPTREQINDGAIAVLEHRLEGKHQNIYSAHTSTGGEVFAAYRAMLAAAQPPSQKPTP